MMQELEKILEEINEIEDEYTNEDHDIMFKLGVAGIAGDIKDIIRKHMNDGWIPLEKCLPEDGENALWCSDDGRMMIGVFHKDYYLEFGIAVAENYNQIMHDCAAWMPLPEKYDPKRRKQKHDC